MVQSETRPQPDWHAALETAVHKLSEPKQHWKEERANIPPQQWELMTSYRNTSGYCC